MTEDPDAWDVLHSRTRPDLHWTTANIGEALPGVQTPLSCSVWIYPVEHGLREAAYSIGALTASERRLPHDRHEYWTRPFFGRLAFQVEFLTMLGDRLPGTSGRQTATGVFGEVPDDIEYSPTIKRYPVVALQLPRQFLTAPGRALRLAARTDRWHRAALRAIPAGNADQTRATIRDAHRRLDQIIVVQTQTVMAVVQPLFDALIKLAALAGTGDIAILSGSGGAEVAVVSDVWEAANGNIPLSTVIANHGFHGPAEGELSSRVWREDDEPLRRLLPMYEGRPHPRPADDNTRRRAEQRAVLNALPRIHRPLASLVLRLAERRILIRGVAKRSFLQAFDVTRACARHLGELLHADGHLAGPDDVFYLSLDELLAPASVRLADLATQRRARHLEYTQVELPTSWKGAPRPISTDPGSAGSPRDHLTGIGVSAGIVEGTCRVVTDPSWSDSEPDEILVAPTTDPSWSSIMYVSSGLVVDIGGPLSHAAIVARELGIPCVVATGTGTKDLRTGDRIRIDGTTGDVAVVERAPQTEPTS